MNYQERMDYIEAALSRFQARYTPPRAMSPDAQTETFEAICKSINRKFPSKVTTEGLRERLELIFEHVSDRHETNAWPLQAEYTKAINATAGRAVTEDHSEDWRVNSLKIMARRIKAGEPVGSEWIYGRGLRELKALAGITDADVEPYQMGQFHDDWNTLNDIDEALRRERDRKDGPAWRMKRNT